MKNFALTALALSMLVTGLNACSTTQPAESIETPHALSPSGVPVNNNQSADQSSHDTPTQDSHDAHTITWSYAGDTGPDYWGNTPENKTCSIGIEQSPINFTKVQVENTPAPKPNYKLSNINVVNNGHTVVYTPEHDNNTTLINGEVYTLKQFHYHAPSEHQISGVNYPTEFHFVHINKTGNLAVIGVMLNPTASTPQLGRLLNNSELATENNTSAKVNAVDLMRLIPRNTAYYHYKGSLTTPPCSEKVKWFVAETPLAVSGVEINMLKDMYTGNNRPVQPLGERPVVYLK